MEGIALTRVDFANLQARLRQDSVQEKITGLWFQHLLERAESDPIAFGCRLSALGLGTGSSRTCQR